MYQPPENLRESELYQRSSFQVALLMFLTLGLYVFWWSYRVRRSAAALLEEPDAAGWKSAGLIVPLLNLFLTFELFEKIKIASIRMGLQPPQAIAAWGVIGVIAFAIGGKLIPLPYTALIMFSFVPFAIAHHYLTRAELLATRGKASPRNFSIVEILLIILGIGVRALYMFGYTVHETAQSTASSPDFQFRTNAWFGWAVLLGVIALLVYFYRQGHQLVQEKLTPA